MRPKATSVQGLKLLVCETSLTDAKLCEHVKVKERVSAKGANINVALAMTTFLAASAAASTVGSPFA
jgi:hypothetical protein